MNSNAKGNACKIAKEEEAAFCIIELNPDCICEPILSS
jgi:hypothetical protein